MKTYRGKIGWKAETSYNIREEKGIEEKERLEKGRKEARGG